MKSVAVRGTRGDDDRGAVAVEFAIVLIPLLVLVLGTIQYGYYFFTAQSASSAARETARRLSVGDCQDPADALAYARRQANNKTLTLAFGTADPSSDSGIASGTAGTLPDPGDQLRVVVEADGGIIGFVPMPNGGKVQRVTDTRVEDSTEESC